MRASLRCFLLCGLLLALRPALAGGWIAFVAPDMGHTRDLFDDLRARAAADLKAHGLEMRFVALPLTDGPEVEARLAQVVSENPRVIFAASSRVALAARASTTTIPVVFGSVADPVRIGLVESLARPGGNATGFTYDVLVEGKQLELVAELAPRARTIGVLEDGHWLGERITPGQLAGFERQLGRRIEVLRAAGPEDIVELATGARARDVDAWFVPISNAASERRRELVEALNRQRRVAVYGRSFFVEVGGLAAYQEIIADPMGLWLGILQTLLRGTAPGAIPVQRPKEYELALNRDTARRIGVPLSPGLLRRADRVLGAGGS